MSAVRRMRLRLRVSLTDHEICRHKTCGSRGYFMKTCLEDTGGSTAGMYVPLLAKVTVVLSLHQ